jgi:hypothetical protein
MSERDYTVGTVALPQVGKMPSKPSYLVSLIDTTGKSKALINFIALDKPELQPGFILAKGFYSKQTEDEISANLADILSKTPKEHYLDLMLPTHRVYSIKSLVFNANKQSTLNK